MHLCGRAIDLVGKHQVVEDWPLLKMERAVFGTVDVGAGDVARQQIGCKLNAMEVAVDRAGEFFDRARLREAGCTFNEQVSAAQQRGHQPFDQRPLADDALVEPVHHDADFVLLLRGDCLHVLPCSKRLSL